MSGQLGVELTATRLRAVLRSPWGQVTRTVDVPWDPALPLEGVRALRTALADTGTPDTIALAVGLGLLHLSRVTLPPADHEAKQAMVSLEPARWFASDAALDVTLAPGDDVALAVDSALLERWCAAFAEWAPLERCEGAPTALARALPPSATGRFSIDAGGDEQGVVELRQGVVIAARRVPHVLGGVATTGIVARADVAPPFAVALGAALADDEGSAGLLAPRLRRRAMQQRATRRFATAALAALAASAFAVLALDRWRERTLATLESDAVQLARAARPALDAQERIAVVAREQAMIGEAVSRRADPSAALAAISQALPAGAVVLSARASGDDWRIDGTATDAAALVPAFDRDGRFEDVRTVSASTRFRDGARSRETFSLAVRVRAKP